MPKIKTLTLAMSAVSMMAGCASTQTSQGVNGLKMEAVQRVTHSQNNPQAFYQLGRYYHGQTRYELALEAYRQALSLQPQYVDALTGMGVAHAMLGQYDDALRVLKAAASIDPFSVTAQNNLGYIYWLLNERDEAMRAYRQALKLDPENARARDNMRLAMKDAADDPVEVAADGHPETAPDAPQAAASIAASQDVGPQLNELRVPAPPVPADPRGAQSETNNSGAAVAGPNADSGLALNEVAPRVYELSRPVQEAERVASLPDPKSTVSPAAADSAAYLKVMNGNGVLGMAHEVARYLAAQGYPSAGTGNQPRFNETQTRIEYRPGQAEEARRLSRLLPVQAVLSEATALGGQVTMRLVLGKDIRHAPDTWRAGKRASPTAGGYAGTPRVTNYLRLVVANGNGVKGIARKVADYLAGRGYRTTRVHDLRPFNKAVTRVEYRKGYASQAIRLGGQLPGKVAYVESAGLRTEVRLVLGHDIKPNMAAWSPRLEDVKLADADAATRL